MIQETANFKAPIYSITAIEGGKFGVVDKNSTVRIIDAKTLQTVDGFKTKLTHKHRTYNIAQLSKSGRFSLIGQPMQDKAAFFANKDRRLLAQVGMHNGEIESVAFSPDEHYMATGGTDGRTFVYATKTAALLVALAPHRDYVSAIAFSANNRWVATGSFDRTIHIKNIATMSEHFALAGHTAPITQLEFVNSELMLSIDKEGNVLLWDLFNRRVKKRLPKMLEEASDMALTHDGRFLFVGTRLGNIGLYDLESFEQLNKSYIKTNSAVTSLAIDKATGVLCYGTEDGFVHNYSLTNGDEELQALVSQGSYTKAYKLVFENAMLRFSPHYAQLEHIWEESVEKAKTFLTQEQPAQAKAILAPFEYVSGKQSIIKALLNDFVDFSKFKELVKNSKFNLAYSLVGQRPVFKETQEFKALEEVWERQLSKAKKDILEKAGDEKAREHLALFRGVSHKAKLITELFNQRKAYLFFRKKLAQKDYVSLFQITKAHPFLREMQEYKDLMRVADAIFITINHYYANHEYMSAIKAAEQIKDFPGFKEELSSLMRHSQVYIDFEQAILQNDLKQIYFLLERYAFLSDLPQLDTIDREWASKIDEAQAMASKGDARGVLTLLREYFKIFFRRNVILNLLKVAYTRQVQHLIKKAHPKEAVAQAITRLYGWFGEDAMFDAMLDAYNKNYSEHLELEMLYKGSSATLDFAILPPSVLA
ncbi:MAG: hypothetical protein KU37_09050 [Sulfuricurvum sp. PC08-66]|nr:MAG: hypothetical protein KU37_09050 [Sulfuricurvum sp. PC08-66]